MAINKRLNAFRESATDELWAAVVQDQETLTPDEFKEKYGFTWNAIRIEATNRGAYEPKRNVSDKPNSVDEEDRTDITVPKSIALAEFKTRSVQLTDAVDDLLEQAYKANPQYEKRYVLNTILFEALRNRYPAENN